MIKIGFLSGALALAFAGSALAQPAASDASMAPPDPSAPMATPQYVMAASQSDEFEMQEGRMAESQAKSTKLRKFGAMMVKDHTKTTNTLHDAIMKSGMSVPPPPPLRPDQMQMVAQLQQLNGADFDKAYLAQQMQSHQEALMVQSNYARNGDTPAIARAASKAVPVVKEHIAMLQDMQGTMGQ